MKNHKKLVIDDEIYIMLRNKQNELIKKTGQYIQLEDITKISLKSSINDVHIESDKNGWVLTTDMTNMIEYTCAMCETKFIDKKNHKSGNAPGCPSCGEPVDSELFRCKCGTIINLMSKEFIKNNTCPLCSHDYKQLSEQQPLYKF